MLEKPVAALAAAVLLVLAAAAGAQDATASDRDAEAEAEALLAVWEEHFNAGDGARAAEMVFAEDARLLPYEHPMVEGREAIAEFWQGAFDYGCSNLDLTLIAADKVGDDTIIETSAYRVDCPNEQGDAEEEVGKAIHIWKKQTDGSWRIAQDIWNTDE